MREKRDVKAAIRLTEQQIEAEEKKGENLESPAK